MNPKIYNRMNRNEFKQTGMNLDDLNNMVIYKDSIIKYLRDIQNTYRVKRSINKDPEDRLLIGSEIIDEIISNFEQVEKAREEYFNKLEKKEK